MNKTSSIFFILLLLLSTFSFGQQKKQTGKIKIVVTDIENEDGHILISLFDSKEGFPSSPDTPLITRKHRIKNNTVECEFAMIPYGTYAIAIMHDENDNGEMDSNLIGIPKEGAGVSNDAIRTFGPPKFEEAKFNLDEDEMTMTISMHYY